MKVGDGTASIRELRTDFRSVKRKIEEFGRVVITDSGIPSYEMKPIVPGAVPTRAPLPDYYARLLREQPKPMTGEQSRRLYEDNRGDR